MGKSVVDQDGNLVGTVKDVDFVIGKQGISLLVEDKNGGTQDISWDAVQACADFIVLKPSQGTNVSAEVAQRAAQPVQFAQQPAAQAAPQTQPAQPLCPICHQPLTWIPQYKRWYCYKDQKYA